MFLEYDITSTMSQTYATLIAKLDADWMSTFRVLQKNRKSLQTMFLQLEDAFDGFLHNPNLYEEEKVRTIQKSWQLKKLEIISGETRLKTIDSEISDSWDHFHTNLEREEQEMEFQEARARSIPTTKDMSRSARSQSRRPLIGNKTRGGCPYVVTGREHTLSTAKALLRRGENTYNRLKRCPEETIKYTRRPFAPHEDIFIPNANKLCVKNHRPKKNKSRRDLIFFE